MVTASLHVSGTAGDHGIIRWLHRVIKVAGHDDDDGAGGGGGVSSTDTRSRNGLGSRDDGDQGNHDSSGSSSELTTFSTRVNARQG